MITDPELNKRLHESLYSVARNLSGWSISEEEAQILEKAIPLSNFGQHCEVLSITMTDETEIQPLIEKLKELDEKGRKHANVIIVHGYEQKRMDKLDPNWFFDHTLSSLFQHMDFPVLIVGQRFGGLSGSLSGRLQSSQEAYRSRH